MSTAGQHAAPHWYDPKRPYYTPMPERTPAAIRAELPAELRARFEAEYEAALEEARRTYDLGRVDEVVRSWWQTVWADRKPGMEQAHADDEVGLDRVLEFDHADAGELVGEAFGLVGQQVVPGGKRRGGGAKQRDLLQQRQRCHSTTTQSVPSRIPAAQRLLRPRVLHEEVSRCGPAQRWPGR
jgi:hypothetical protein